MRKFFGDMFFKPVASLRQLEQDMETVMRILQPGPLGVIEHKFSDNEINQARMSVQKAIESWSKRNRDDANRKT